MPLFAFLLMRSALYYRYGKQITWKGRAYRPSEPPQFEPREPAAAKNR